MICCHEPEFRYYESVWCRSCGHFSLYRFLRATLKPSVDLIKDFRIMWMSRK